MNPERLGWKAHFEVQAPRGLDHPGAFVGRVITEDREGLDVMTHDGRVRRVVVGGGYKERAASRIEYPAVGDWLVAADDEGGEVARVVDVYERTSRLVRQAAGRRVQPQVIAANIDVVFIVTAMTEEFEPRRLERYLLMAYDSGARPIIVLNKADLADDPERYAREAEVVSAGAPVVAISAVESVEPMRRFVRRGTTAVLVGSSGVGKSTIINALVGEARMPTGEVREDDHAGRHTTTARELVLLPDDTGLLVDTPGIRELQPWAGDVDVDVIFDDVADRAAQCRFRDCAHEDEPGCAVANAIDDGELDASRLASYRKLKAELAEQCERQEGR